MAEAEAQPAGRGRPEDRAGRRLARFSVSPVTFVSLGRGRFEVVDNPLPGDAEIVESFYDEGRDQFAVIIESESFEPAVDGRPVPEVNAPTIRRIHADE